MFRSQLLPDHRTRHCESVHSLHEAIISLLKCFTTVQSLQQYACATQNAFCISMTSFLSLSAMSSLNNFHLGALQRHHNVTFFFSFLVPLLSCSLTNLQPDWTCSPARLNPVWKTRSASTSSLVRRTQTNTWAMPTPSKYNYRSGICIIIIIILFSHNTKFHKPKFWKQNVLPKKPLINKKFHNFIWCEQTPLRHSSQMGANTQDATNIFVPQIIELTTFWLKTNLNV